MSRDERQQLVAQWCSRAFGVEHALSKPQRAIRLLEEVIEAYQAVDCDREMAHRLVDYVFDRPPGDIKQELGGVGITLLALANACSCSADTMERVEFSRVLEKPIEHFTKRNQAKNDAGFNVVKPGS